VHIVRTITDLRTTVAIWRQAGQRVGLVPTMGALHAGHMALVEAARRRCDRVVTSIFVNPKQFAPNEDLASYPRPESADLALLQRASVDLAYVPDEDQIYPVRFSTVIRVGGLSEGLCGAHRAGHFDGVATVVTKLLIQSLPDFAYFGEKDYQQLLIVRRLARDLDLPVRIEGVAIVREPDGLALSSRNAYLTPPQRRVAPRLAQVLRDVAAVLEREPAAVARETERGRAELTRAGFDVEYLEIRAAEDLAPIGDVVSRPCRVLAAAYVGRTRLIDNFPIEPPKST
jgi:pantoate--beta-alanine ligase